MKEHEMVHQWQEDHGTPPRGGYHDKEWAAKMRAIGLIPSNTGEPGGKETGQQMSHYIDPKGPFSKAFKAMPKDVSLPWLSGDLPDTEKPEPSKNKNKVKYTCPECEACVWGKSGLAIGCQECDASFIEEEPNGEPQ